MSSFKALLRKHGINLLRVVVLLLIAWWLSDPERRKPLFEAVRRLPMWALAAAFATMLFNMIIAGLRWRVLMRAFGAKPLPSPWLLGRIFMIGLFYNTYVPGTVGGDIVRGVVSQRHFESAAASYVVVFLERLIGLSALGVVFGLGLLLGPPIIPWSEAAPWIGALVAAGFAILVGARVSGRLASWWSQIPRVHERGDLLLAFAISLVGHGLNLLVFWLLVRGLALDISALELAVVVPLALVASVLPIAIAGIGPREAAMTVLLAQFGATKAEAIAVSLGYAAALLGVAALGGLVQLVWGIPRDATDDSDTSRSSAAAPPPG